jgi:aminopeptidase N
MKWWDDLWLNEAFATMIAHKCMDEAEGLEDVKHSWNIF